MPFTLSNAGCVDHGKTLRSGSLAIPSPPWKISSKLWPRSWSAEPSDWSGNTRDKAAGFRTIILITVGATIFTIFSLRLGGDDDPVRIAAGVVSGVGFLGAGVILRHRGEIVGITTAATIWLAAGLGMGIGSGNYATSATAATAVLIILWLFPTIEYRIDRAKETHSYQISTSIGSSVRSDLKVVLDQHRLSLYDEKMGKLGDTLLLHWKVSGPHAGHEAFALSMLDAPEVLEFDY